jgi:hypothetical protein
MSKRIALFCALIGVLAFVACPAYAEVQNIKVSGEITALGVHRNNYDLEDARVIEKNLTQFPSNYREEDNDTFAMSIIKLRVDADLTDNVGACVQVGNIREWDSDAHSYETAGAAAVATGDSVGQIELDLAYITLKEMLYSPLTLIIGRQNLQYGRGMIVGPGLYRDTNNSIKYNDLSPFQGYDAVRAILDYDPWTLDFVFAKMIEDDDVTEDTDRDTSEDDRDSDTDLYGANLGYKFDQYDAEMEGYLFYKRDMSYDLGVSHDEDSDTLVYTFDTNKVWTVGLRGSIVPVENLTINGEGGFQWGEICDIDARPTADDMTRDREAWMGNISAEYDFADVRFNPVLGAEYLYVSGEEVDGNAVEHEDTSDFEAWHPIYRGRKLGTLRDCLETLYPTNDPSDSSGWTNQHTIKGSCAVDLGELVDGLTLDIAALHYWFAEGVAYGDDEDDIGDELNMALTYDYTEDVQFVVDGAWFFPGEYYDSPHYHRPIRGGGYTADTNTTNINTVLNRVSNDTAVSIIGSCKVVF